MQESLLSRSDNVATKHTVGSALTGLGVTTDSTGLVRWVCDVLVCLQSSAVPALRGHSIGWRPVGSERFTNTDEKNAPTGVC